MDRKIVPSRFWSAQSKLALYVGYYIFQAIYYQTVFSLPGYADKVDFCFLKFHHFRFPRYLQLSHQSCRNELIYEKFLVVEEWPCIFSFNLIDQYFDFTLSPYVTLIYSQHRTM